MSVDRYGGVEFEGIRQLRRDLKKLGGPELQARFRERMKAAVDAVVADARSRAPVYNGPSRPDVTAGALRDSIKAFASGSKFGVQGGSSRVDYYGWIDFGGTNPPAGHDAPRGRRRREFLKKGRIMYPAVDAHLDDVRRAAEAAIDQTISEANL